MGRYSTHIVVFYRKVYTFSVIVDFCGFLTSDCFDFSLQKWTHYDKLYLSHRGDISPHNFGEIILSRQERKLWII